MQLSCTCGRKLRVGDAQAGERVKCPSCGKRIMVPKAEAQPAAAMESPGAAASPPATAKPNPAPPPFSPSAPESVEARPATPVPHDDSTPIPTPGSAGISPPTAGRSQSGTLPAHATKSGSVPRARRRVRVPEDKPAAGGRAGIFTGMVILLIIGGGLWWMISRREDDGNGPPPSEPTESASGVASLQNVARLVFSRDGKRLAVAVRNPSVHEGAASQQIWDLASDRLLVKVAGHSASVSQLAMSANGALLATSSGNEAEVRIWRISDGRLQQRLVEGQAKPPLGEELLAFSPDSKSVLSIMQGTIVKMDAETPIVDRQPYPVIPNTRAAASPVAPILAISTVTADRPPRPIVDLYDYEAKESKPIGLSATATALAISGDGNTLAVATSDGVIQLVDVHARRLKSTLPKPKDAKYQYIKRLSLNADGTWLCCLPYGIGRPNVEVWDVAARKHRVLEFENCLDAAISPDGKTVAIGVNGGPIRFVDPTTGVARASN